MGLGITELLLILPMLFFVGVCCFVLYKLIQRK